MKRSVLIALAAFALAGCAKESVVDSALTNAGNAIGFNTYSNITRGNPFDNNPEFAASGNVFGVTAFISTSDSPYMGKADAGTEIVSDGTKWDYKNTSDIRYWPTQGETLSFYAYAPYTKNGVAIPVAYTKGDGMIMTDYTVPADDAGQVDLMYASALNVAKASPAVKVPLQFKHAMTQVRFKAKAKGDGVFIDVKENGIKLSNLKSKGTFTLSAAGAASWSITEGNLTEYTAVFPETKEITNAEAKNLYDADKALILLPQEFAAKTGDGDMTGGTLTISCKIYYKDNNATPPVSVRFGRHVCRLHGSVQQQESYRRYGGGRDLEDEQAHYLYADRHRQPRTYPVQDVGSGLGGFQRRHGDLRRSGRTHAPASRNSGRVECPSRSTNRTARRSDTIYKLRIWKHEDIGFGRFSA